MRRNWLSLLMILIMLLVNIGFVPDAYADSADNTSNSLQASDTSGNSGSITQGSSTIISQDDSAAANLVANATSSSTTSSVYSNNPDEINQVINYPAAPSNITAFGANAPQADTLRMSHVVKMPKEVHKQAPITTTNNNKIGTQNVTGPSVASSKIGTATPLPSPTTEANS